MINVKWMKKYKLDIRILSKYIFLLALSLSKTTVSKMITFMAQISESRYTHCQFKMEQRTCKNKGLDVVIETYCTIIYVSPVSDFSVYNFHS